MLEAQRHLVRETFGSTICAPDGTIDRRKLGKMVFRNARARDKLEKILHPIMRHEIQSMIERLARHHVVIDAALLLYMELHPLCDTILWITASWCLRVMRAMRRDQLSLLQAWQRIRSQQHLEAQISHINADIHTMKNNGSVAALHHRLAQWVAYIE